MIFDLHVYSEVTRDEIRHVLFTTTPDLRSSINQIDAETGSTLGLIDGDTDSET